MNKYKNVKGTPAAPAPKERIKSWLSPYLAPASMARTIILRFLKSYDIYTTITVGCDTAYSQ